MASATRLRADHAARDVVPHAVDARAGIDLRHDPAQPVALHGVDLVLRVCHHRQPVQQIILKSRRVPYSVHDNRGPIQYVVLLLACTAVRIRDARVAAPGVLGEGRRLTIGGGDARTIAEPGGLISVGCGMVW